MEKTVKYSFCHALEKCCAAVAYLRAQNSFAWASGTKWLKEQTFNRPDKGKCEVKSTYFLSVIIFQVNWNQTIAKLLRLSKLVNYSLYQTICKSSVGEKENLRRAGRKGSGRS